MYDELELKEKATLGDIQAYVKDLEKTRGFEKNNLDPIKTALQLTEEVGELCKAIRKRERIRVARDSHVSDVAEELADVLIFTAAIANRYKVDLETALRDKDERNRRRVWV